MEAVRVAGGRTYNILFRQILPNVIPSIAVIASINVADAILTEAGLTYLGLGPNISLPDWGWDIFNGKNLLLVWGVVGVGISWNHDCASRCGICFYRRGLERGLEPETEER